MAPTHTYTDACWAFKLLEATLSHTIFTQYARDMAARARQRGKRGNMAQPYCALDGSTRSR